MEAIWIITKTRCECHGPVQKVIEENRKLKEENHKLEEETHELRKWSQFFS